MRRSLIMVLLATTVAGAGLCGCADTDRADTDRAHTDRAHTDRAHTDRPTAANPPAAPVLQAPPADPGPLPAPEALSTVLDRLADPNLPVGDKLSLVQDASPADAAALDGFGAALRDGGFTPITFTAADLTWSDSRTGAVLATVRATTSGPEGPGEFSFPMEFRPSAGGWQLSRDTAEQLLAFGNARTGAPASATETPP